MAVVAGQRNTSNVDQTSRRLDIGSRIALLDSTSTPFTALLNKISSRKCISPKFSNYTDTLPPRVDTLNHGSNPTSSTSPITVSNGAYFNVEDLVLVPATKELMRVTAISTNSLTVTRGVGSTAATITDATQLYIVSSAAMEGDVSKQARSDTPTKVDNYTQIFKDPVDESGTALSSDFLFDEHDFTYAKRKKGIEHSLRIERSAWWGRPSETGTPAVRTTGGFFHFQGTTNATDAGGSWTEAELWNAAPGLFRHGSGRKLMFAGGVPLSVISQWAQSKVLTRTDDSTYGIAITELQAPSGRLGVVHHPLFDDTTVYSGYAAVLDMDDDVAKRYLAGGIGGSRDTNRASDIQENDRDGKKDEYRSDVGFQFGDPQRHGYFYGVTGT